MKYLNSYDSSRELKTWLVQIAINCFKNEIETINKYVDLEDISEQQVYENKDDDFNMIKPLSSTERIIFTLKYVYDYKNEDIAKSLAMNINTIKSIIKRALVKLK